MAKDWIKGAIKHKGALKEKAKAAGESTQAFAKGHDTGSSTTARQSRLAETLKGFVHHGKGK